jgi:hypothetical protein
MTVTAKPTAQPTRQPSFPSQGSPVSPSPSRAPTPATALVTSAPSVSSGPGGYQDCSVSCSFLTSGSASISTNTVYAVVTVSTYFKLVFDYMPSSLGSYPYISNILDLRDTVTGASLLYVSLPWSTNSVLGYGGDMLEQWGPNLQSSCQSTFTTFTVVVKAGIVTITSSNDPNWLDTFCITNVDTTGRSYRLYLSNPNDGTNTRSAGGFIKNIYLTGSRPVQTVSMPTTDCTSSCSFLTNGNTLNVRANQTYAVVSLNTYFRISFEYRSPVIGAYPTISNILDLRDCSSAQSLLSVGLPWTSNTAIGYNGEQIEMWGPTLVSSYQSSTTTITIEVAQGKVTIVASSDNNWYDVKHVSANVVTTSRLYYLYLSSAYVDFNNPNLNENRPSAQGVIRNIQITGKFTNITFLHYSWTSSY